MLSTVLIEISNESIANLVMVLFVIAITVAYTVLVLRANGVNKDNHGLFVAFFHLKYQGATVEKISSEVFSYVLDRTSSNSDKAIGTYDITPIRLFDDETVEKAFEMIKNDLSIIDGVKSVTIENNKRVILIVE